MKINKYLQKLKIVTISFLKDPLFLGHWESPFYRRRRNDNQLSVRTVGKRKAYTNNGDSYMFVQDMSTGIMPFMIYKGERDKYPIRIEPSSPDKERLIAEGISNRSYNSSLSDALCDFVQTTSHILFQNGVALYEIIYKKNDIGEIESFDLELLRPSYLLKVFNNYYQFIPWWEAKWSYERVQVIKIPAEKILRIDFPSQFGSKRKIKKILKRLYDLSKVLFPNFHIDAMARNENIGFDVNDFMLSKYLEVARLTKDFGWNQRQASGDNITEYYSMLRFLRTKKTEAIVREEIIKALNEILNRSPLNFGVKIIVENLFTPKFVDEQEKILEKGNIRFMDILNALKI